MQINENSIKWPQTLQLIKEQKLKGGERGNVQDHEKDV